MSTELLFDAVVIPTVSDLLLLTGIALLALLALSCVMKSQREKRTRP
jgi:hypothetical protein